MKLESKIHKRRGAGWKRNAKKRIVKRDGLKCKANNCKRVFLTPQGLTLDHVIPLSRGGSNEDSNLQLLCNKHHKKKDRHS